MCEVPPRISVVVLLHSKPITLVSAAFMQEGCSPPAKRFRRRNTGSARLTARSLFTSPRMKLTLGANSLDDPRSHQLVDARNGFFQVLEREPEYLFEVIDAPAQSFKGKAARAFLPTSKGMETWLSRRLFPNCRSAWDRDVDELVGLDAVGVIHETAE